MKRRPQLNLRDFIGFLFLFRHLIQILFHFIHCDENPKIIISIFIMRHYIELNNMDEDYEGLKEKIESFYGQPFELILETKHITKVSYVMVIDFSFFLRYLKTKEPHLTYTTILVYSEYIYNLLSILFTYLARPMAPVKVLYFESELKYIKTYYP